VRELVRTNDAALISAIEALLAAAHIPYVAADANMSVLAGSTGAIARRILVGDCCLADARGLLAEAGYTNELAGTDQSRPP
jgi:hypothetical protein